MGCRVVGLKSTLYLVNKADVYLKIESPVLLLQSDPSSLPSL